MINLVNMKDYVEADLDELFENGVHILKFYKEGCAPCQDVTNQLNQLFFDGRANATVYSVNVKECPEVAGEFSIFSVPTLVFLKDNVDGNDLLSFIGVITSSLAPYILQGLNPTLNYQTGDVLRFPLPIKKI